MKTKKHKKKNKKKKKPKKMGAGGGQTVPECRTSTPAPPQNPQKPTHKGKNRLWGARVKKKKHGIAP